MTKISTLGSIPAKSQEYAGFSLKDLYEELKECNETLRKNYRFEKAVFSRSDLARCVLRAF